MDHFLAALFLLDLSQLELLKAKKKKLNNNVDNGLSKTRNSKYKKLILKEKVKLLISFQLKLVNIVHFQLKHQLLEAIMKLK